jgi:tetratricopeptide (TPR) repeat protein
MYESALESYESCLKRIKALDEADCSILLLRCLRGMGDCHFSLGQFDPAMNCYQRAQVLEQKRTEPSAEGYLLTNRIARAWYALEDPERAEEYHRKSLEQVIAHRGEAHRDVALAHSNLAEILVERGCFGEAQDHLKDSLAIRQQVFGEEHPEVSQCLLEIGKAWRKAGRYERAIKALQQCMAMRLQATSSLFGTAHGQVADVAFQIGILEEQRGSSGSAIQSFRQCLAIRDRIHSAPHRLTATVLNHLGHSLHHAGLSQEAVEVLERCLELRVQLFGLADLRTANVQSSLGWVWNESGRPDQALPYLVACAQARRELLAQDHPDRMEADLDMVHAAHGLAESESGKVIQMCRDED